MASDRSDSVAARATSTGGMSSSMQPLVRTSVPRRSPPVLTRSSSSTHGYTIKQHI